jgi:hypothetical protein
MRRYLLLITAGLLLLAGCGHVARNSAPLPPHTGIVGRVLVSGGAAPGLSADPQSEVKVIDSAGTVVAVATPKPDGMYKIDLLPGDYTVEAHPTSGNPRFDSEKVSVQVGRYITVDIYAQVGL